MEQDVEGWSADARRMLQRLRQPALLERDRTGTALRDALGTATVHDAVRACVERALAHTDPRMAKIVQRCDVEGDTTKAVAHDLHMSMRHLFRFRVVIFDALGAEIARAIESRVVVPRDERRAEALRRLARAEFTLARMHDGDDLRAIALAERALADDPSLARAWYVIASASMSLALRSAVDPQAGHARAAQALDRADAMAPRNGTVAGLRASLSLWRGDEERAEDLAGDALASSSGMGRGHYTLGWMAARRGDFDEAERHFAAALAVEPYISPYHSCAMAVVHLRGDYERCADRCRELYDAEPGHPYVLGYYTETLNALGRFADTVALVAAAPPAAMNFTVASALVRAHAMLGDMETARAAADGFDGPAVSRAAVALSLGDEDGAWHELERAQYEPNGMLELAQFDAVFAPFYDEPRFRRLVS